MHLRLVLVHQVPSLLLHVCGFDKLLMLVLEVLLKALEGTVVFPLLVLGLRQIVGRGLLVDLSLLKEMILVQIRSWTLVLAIGVNHPLRRIDRG